MSIAIIAAEFNEFIVNRLLQGAEALLKKQKVAYKVYRVPGAFELPLAAQHYVKKHAAVICLGAVIRGETPHFDYVCAETARGIMQVGLESSKPVIFGVLTTDTVAQAEARSTKQNNKGADAAAAAMKMLEVL